MTQFTYTIDGYNIAERLLEGFLYEVTVQFADDVDLDTDWPFAVVNVTEANPDHPYIKQFVQSQRELWVEQIREQAAEDDLMYEAYLDSIETP